MRFDYYDRLSKRQQAIYRKSDATTAVTLPDSAALVPLADGVRHALGSERCADVRHACNQLVDALLDSLAVPAARVRVLAARPSTADSELHGLYERDDDSGRAVITVWMRTAAKKKVVAYRTFMRTLLHELCHHLDYDQLKLADSYHTEGFFKRESSLARQLLGERAAHRSKPHKRKRAHKSLARSAAAEPRRWQQLELPFFG